MEKKIIKDRFDQVLEPGDIIGYPLDGILQLGIYKESKQNKTYPEYYTHTIVRDKSRPIYHYDENGHFIRAEPRFLDGITKIDDHKKLVKLSAEILAGYTFAAGEYERLMARRNKILDER